MRYDRAIFDEPHQQSLELLAVQKLAAGDAVAAFAYADRRCRIAPPPGPYNYTLRGEALFQLGDRAAAIADLARAINLAPDDIAANRRMLAWADGARRIDAAVNLVARERDPKIFRDAVAILCADGRRNIGHATVYDDVVRGWAVWQQRAALEVTIASNAGFSVTLIEPNSFHALADLGRAVNFTVRRPRSSTPQSIILAVGDEVIYSTRAPANEAPLAAARGVWRPASEAGSDSSAAAPRRVAVIVPVFADYEATRLCLESVLATLSDADHHHVIVVNDATPDAGIAKYLRKVANHPAVRLLTNPHNLGFVGAVNRALEQLDNEDVILLNSDTIVPKDFIARLAAAAKGAPEIGTVTPLSNSGEETSFPLANTINPIGTPEEVMAIDAIAATVNSGRLVDIPNGTGFCLYITRACLDAVGFLSEDFYRGYFEDVEFCLQARARGFRNVCAPSVYVGHAGSRSFGREKQALLARNFAVLERRYPTYRAELAAFNSVDPLARSRQAIERAMPQLGRRPRLLLTGGGAVARVAAERARQLVSEKEAAMIMEVHDDSAGPIVRVFDAAGTVPQSLKFDLSIVNESDAMIQYLRAIEPSAVEIVDPAHLPVLIVDQILSLRVSHEMFLADAGIVGASRCRAIANPIRGETRGAAGTSEKSDSAHSAERWQVITATADRVLAPTDQAWAFAQSRFDRTRIRRVGKVNVVASKKPLRRRRAGMVSRLGLLLARSDREELHFISAVARAMRLADPATAIVVLGATGDDLGLMQNGNVFVTGMIDPPDLEAAVTSYRLQALLVTATRPIFGHPMVERGFTAGIPIAFFDWSKGRFKPKRGDLALDPAASFDSVMRSVRRWTAKA